MKKAILLLMSLLLLTSFADSAKAQDAKQKITDFMEEALDMYHIPGASLAVLEGEETIYQNQWGILSDGSNVTADTPFLIGSLSKPITSLAIMMLVEDGKIKLDEPIKSYIPSFIYQTDSSKSITVLHLLEQTSGISELEGLKVTDNDYPVDGAINQAIEELSGVTLSNEPGEVYEYNSANYLLLGAIVENVTNQTFSEFLNMNIFNPLGMENSAADYENALEKGYIPGFESWFGKSVVSDGFYDHAGAPYGYIASSSNDVSKFLKFMLAGGNLLSEQNLKLLKALPEEGKTYGFGWHFSKTEHFPFHGGATSDFRAQMFIIPEEDIAAVLLTNKYNFLEDAQVSHIMNGVRSILKGEIPNELPLQSYSIQWSMLAITLLLAFLMIIHFFYIIRKKILNKKRELTIAILSLCLAVILIPLFEYVIGSPWKSISFFAPDIAFLIYCIVVIFALNGIMTLIIYTWK
ncbi:putative penicillin-binding protein [Bacillus sp. TS-2]|nr:putative penicillin-binding protein [Bacillus sp. TS-2]